MTAILKTPLHVGAAATALALGFASVAGANPVTINPGANDTGYGGAGNYQLETGVVGNTAITGGLGTGFEKVFMGTNNSGTGPYAAEFVVNITSLTGISGNLGLGSTWQLFALVTVTGNGTWATTTTNGKTPTFTSAPGSTVGVQIYGVKGTGDTFNDPTLVNFAPTALAQHTSVSHDTLTAGSGSVPDHDNLGTSNMSHVGTHACWDGTNIGGSSNCILLADGTNSTISLVIAGQANTGNTEEFSISTLLSPESYTTGTGFWGNDGPVNLTINSGGGTTEQFVPVNDNTCHSSPVVCQFESGSGVPVNWDVTDSVPEPGSLALFGSGLLGLGLLRRRRRT